MYRDADVNRDLYGRDVPAEDILVTPKVNIPGAAQPMIGVLNRYSPRAPYVKK